MAKITIDFGDGRTVELYSDPQDGRYYVSSRVTSPHSVGLQEISKELRQAADNIEGATPQRRTVLDDPDVIDGFRRAGLLRSTGPR